MQSSDTMAGDEVFTFAKDVVPDIGMTNFSPPEDGFIWSTGPWCEIRFSLMQPDYSVARERPWDTVVELSLDMDVFKAAPNLNGQNILFYVNGLRLASRFMTGRVTVILELPGTMVRQNDNIITIDSPDAARPTDHGGSDGRRLGIQLHSLRVMVG
jgi:hypothetical protein